MVDVSGAAAEQCPQELVRLQEENSKLRQALAGHLFDGESVSFREVIRSELIQQGIRLDGALADPSEEMVRNIAESIEPTVFGSRSDAEVGPAILSRRMDVIRTVRAVLLAAREFCWAQDSVGHTETEEVP